MQTGWQNNPLCLICAFYLLVFIEKLVNLRTIPYPFDHEKNVYTNTSQPGAIPGGFRGIGFRRLQQQPNELQ